jgi:rare lipoprotein A
MRQTLFAFSLIAVATVMSAFGIASMEEFGKAGYYADSLQGRKTASGELYNKTELTCAHKSLPFGTKVRITRLDNKKSVIVRVNDRGPFVDGYVTDISRKAAESIGLLRDGVTRVKLEVVEAASSARVAAETDGNTTLLVKRDNAKQTTKAASALTKPTAHSVTDPTPATSNVGATNTELYRVDLKKSVKTGFGIQVTTLNDANNVLPELKKLQTLWGGKTLVLTEKNATTPSYKLILGPYPDKKTAEVQQKLAARKGYKGCFVVDLSEM